MAARPGEVRTSSALAPAPLTPGNVTYNATTGRLSVMGLNYQLACPNMLTLSWVSGPVAYANASAAPGQLPAAAAGGQIAAGAPWPANQSELNPVATVLIQDRIARWRRTNGIAPPPDEAPLHIAAAGGIAPSAGGAPSAPSDQQGGGSGYGGQQYGGQQGQGGSGQGQGQGGQQSSSGQSGQGGQGGQQYGGQQGGGGGSGQGQGSSDDARSRATPSPSGQSGGGGGGGSGQQYSSQGGGSGYNSSPMTSGVSAQSAP